MQVFADVWLANPQNWLVILQVMLGLGFVIFVHELGHFAVAKMCGVKCEKFYLGFDIYGLKLFKKQWGETEYGIGILPLGGYVKMLGQDDNPARAREEMERSRGVNSANPASPTGATAGSSSSAHTGPNTAGQASSGTEPGVPSHAHHGAGGGDLPPEPTEEMPPVHDPRSYLAQSVPERMAIISAGVIMNLIFAVIMAAVAYGMGVEEMTADIADVMPGEAAWRAGLRPGDEVLQIDDVTSPRYRDLKIAVVLSDAEEGVRFKLQRRGEESPVDVVIHPDYLSDRKMPTIGIPQPRNTEVAPPEFLARRMPESLAKQFEAGDQIVELNGQPIDNYADIVAAMAADPSQPLSVVVERQGETDSASERTRHTIELPPLKMRRLGLSMELGPITAVQEGSPAVGKLQPGDKLLELDGEPIGDPFTLSKRVQAKAGQPVTLTIQRKDAATPIAVEITPREVDWFEDIAAARSPMTAPALGIAYQVTSTVKEVLPYASEAAQAIQPGTTFIKAELVLPEGASEEETGAETNALEFSDESPSWPALIQQLQHVPAGSQIKLTAEGDKTFTLPIVEAPDDFDPTRGLVTGVKTQTRTAESIGEAIALGYRETKESALQVFEFLGALGSGRVSPENLGGIGSIATVAGKSAEAGMAHLLLFLTMLSANLAVINFLPIPVLDGGHMVFLIAEGIRGKPLSERVVIICTYIGFAIVLSLILFVNLMDVRKFINWLGS